VKLGVGISELAVVETIRAEKSPDNSFVTANILVKQIPFGFCAFRERLHLNPRKPHN